MSSRAANTCAERKFGSATRKQIIMFLADKASDDGSSIWCSKGTNQRHTELAYDDNRDLIRDADDQPMTVSLEPLPEVLRGNPDRTEALIDASRHQWAYRAGVISFADSDDPTEEQQVEVMEQFERLAFAGLDPEQYEVLWVRHRHDGRVELHFCTPRLELTLGKSLNIAPPGYQDADDSLRNVMNQRHGWADPMDVERAQEVRNTIKAPTRAHGRDELHTWIQDQIDMGLITDRATMIDALTDADFDLPRTGKAYITTRDPETGERWRLKGEIFHEDWQADPAEREVERGARRDAGGTRLGLRRPMLFLMSSRKKASAHAQMSWGRVFASGLNRSVP